jgi:MFS family permease
MLFPLTSLTLERWGVPGTVIGLNGATQALAMLVVGPYLAGLVRRIGAPRALIAGTGLGAGAILGLALLPSLPAWFALRFAIGCGLALPWLIAETWINAIAREGSRGRVIGLYSMALFAGMAGGPLLLQLVGRSGVLPFAVAAGALVLAAGPLLLARGLIPPLQIPAGMGILHALRRAPTVGGAALLAGLSESACYMLLPVYGVRAGVGEGAALTWLTVLILGAIALQTPIGWIADRMDRRRLLGVGAGLGALLPVALYAALDQPWLLWPLLFLMGGVALGYYTVGLALLGARFAPGELAVANAGFMMLYETGTTGGPVLAGAAMELWAPHGYLMALAAFATVFVGLILLRGRAAERGGGSPP